MDIKYPKLFFGTFLLSSMRIDAYIHTQHACSASWRSCEWVLKSPWLMSSDLLHFGLIRFAYRGWPVRTHTENIRLRVQCDFVRMCAYVREYLETGVVFVLCVCAVGKGACTYVTNKIFHEHRKKCR